MLRLGASRRRRNARLSRWGLRSRPALHPRALGHGPLFPGGRPPLRGHLHPRLHADAHPLPVGPSRHQRQPRRQDVPERTRRHLLGRQAGRGPLKHDRDGDGDALPPGRRGDASVPAFRPTGAWLASTAARRMRRTGRKAGPSSPEARQIAELEPAERRRQRDMADVDRRLAPTASGSRLSFSRPAFRQIQTLAGERDARADLRHGKSGPSDGCCAKDAPALRCATDQPGDVRAPPSTTRPAPDNSGSGVRRTLQDAAPPHLRALLDRQRAVAEQILPSERIGRERPAAVPVAASWALVMAQAKRSAFRTEAPGSTQPKADIKWRASAKAFCRYRLQVPGLAAGSSKCRALRNAQFRAPASYVNTKSPR